MEIFRVDNGMPYTGLVSHQVNTCGFPPLEDRDTSISVFMGLDFFGSGIMSKEENLRLSELEKKAVNYMFVILSDVWLDNEETMEKLSVVLDGYESMEVVPSLFVFMGNFCSRPCSLAFHSFSSLRMQYGKLGEMIEAHPRLNEQSQFLFIPGPDDAGPSKALPRCALPKYLTEELQKHIPNAIFSSNPCRIKFYTQEIVLFRQDLLYRMRRSCLIPPSTEETTCGHDYSSESSMPVAANCAAYCLELRPVFGYTQLHTRLFWAIEANRRLLSTQE